MKNINIDTKYLILLLIIAISGMVFTYAHHGHLIIDCGREVYYPTQILLGKVLYKDLFNIYGPLSYMYNAFLFKLFGVNLNVLYISGCVSAIAIISLIYLIAKRFLPTFLSFSIALFTISIGIFNLRLFNFIFPYSYAMLYGLVAFLISFLLLLLYKESPQKNLYLYLSAFFAGFCIACKYDFLPYLIVILYVVLSVKPLKLKEFCFVGLSLLVMPLFCFSILFLQGLSLNDMSYSMQIIRQMAQSQTLKYMYQHNGVFFHKETSKLLIIEFIKTIIPFSLLLISNKKPKFVSALCIILAFYLMLMFFDRTSFAFLPVLIVLWFVFDFKNIRNNQKLLILTLTAISISLKSFWGAIIFSYGNYILSFLLITVLALILEKFKGKNINTNLLAFYFIFASFIFSMPSIAEIKQKDFALSSTRGKIYLEKPFYDSTNELIKYIDKNTQKTDTVVIYPEGAVINFLTERKTDNFYNSFIPLYWEVFGDKKLIEHFGKTKPEYIIFNNWSDPKDYYLGTICNDYAQEFCGYVAKNYKKVKVLDSGFRYLIYKYKGIE